MLISLKPKTLEEINACYPSSEGIHAYITASYWLLLNAKWTCYFWWD